MHGRRKGDEFSASALPLDRIGLRSVVNTADTMRTQCARFKLVINAGGHRLLVAERSQKKLHKQHRHLTRRPSASLSTIQSAAAEP
ncbi:hypothetical protein BIV25_38425 [Streptomyces sp. MUSC 14]|nr:hypothetical protein BIV25_38425 [Streptomyces sp. MUSC 14]